MIAKTSAFSLRSGNWFVSPLFVWGSESLDSDELQLHFDRKLYEDLRIIIQNEEDEIFISADVQAKEKKFVCEMSAWPEGKYILIFQDQEKINSYEIVKD